MNEETRPDPDALLAALRQEEERPRRGRLKIFLGMCAGVGKTYAMLQDAQKRRAEGVRVAAAVVETHGRRETQALAAGLETIPLKAADYRGITLRELDLDAVLARRPDLVLVDELAHTNAPGSRHPKRYQDVQELLTAGIDVYTTLNIQHVESRIDAVSRITGIRVQETVPDSIIDLADEIQLIDLSPEHLRERLKEGRVYLGGKAATAAMNFFRQENLTALREIALRLTAERVGQTLRGVMGSKRIEGPWKTNERPLVAVGSSPYSERLIRFTRRMAASLDSPWVAVYVETPRPLGAPSKTRLEKNLSLARQLGAEVVMVSGEDVVETLLRVARERNATQIIVGKPLDPWWVKLANGGSVVDRLIRRSGDIDIHVVRSEKAPALGPRFERQTGGTWMREILSSTVFVGEITLVGWFAYPFIGYWSVALLYLAGVVWQAMRFHRLTLLWVATLSASLWDYIFIPPRFTFRIGDPQDLMMLLMFFVVAVAIGNLTARLRLREQAEHRHVEHTQALYRIAQGAVESTTLEETLKRALNEILGLFPGRAAVLLDAGDGNLAQQAVTGAWVLDAKELSVAAWAYANRQPAGRFTDTLPDSSAIYFPLHTAKRKSGVLAVGLDQPTLDLGERELLEGIADQLAVMADRYLLLGQADRARLAEASEKMYKLVFDSVSHELKTPLAVITAGAETLRAASAEACPQVETAEEIRAAAVRLRRAVENLLGMSRIESGRLKLEIAWCEVAELVHAAREQVADMLAHHRVRGTLGPDLPLVRLDFGLMVHALSNVMANAAQYSPAGSEIRVSAHVDNGELVIRVADEGPGLPPAEIQRVFDKFYRGANVAAGGSGLGLAIVRALVQAHGGTVGAENNPDRGATFTLRVPVETTSLESTGPDLA